MASCTWRSAIFSTRSSSVRTKPTGSLPQRMTALDLLLEGFARTLSEEAELEFCHATLQTQE